MATHIRDSALSKAVRTSSQPSVQELLSAGADPDAYDLFGWTPVTWAASRGEAAMVEMLIESGADVTKGAVASALTPLHAAAAQGHVAVATVLLDRPCVNIDARTEDGETPLCWAVRACRWEMVDWLTSRGADGTVPGLRGDSPVSQLLQSGRTAEAVRLLTPGTEVSGLTCGGEPVLHWAIRGGHRDVVQRLLSLNALLEDSDYRGRTPLAVAIGREDWEMAMLLIEADAEPRLLDKEGVSCLHGHNPPSEVMAALGALCEKLDLFGDRLPLHRAAQEGRVDDVEWLLAHGGGGEGLASSSGPELLRLAVSGGQKRVVEVLLEAGVPVWGEYWDHWPLQRALAGCRSEGLLDLVLRAALRSVEELQEFLDASLDACVLARWVAGVDRLLGAGAPPNGLGRCAGRLVDAVPKDPEEDALGDCVQIGSLLLAAGASVDFIGSDNGVPRTALELATRRGCPLFAAMLVERGASPEPRAQAQPGPDRARGDRTGVRSWEQSVSASDPQVGQRAANGDERDEPGASGVEQRDAAARADELWCGYEWPDMPLVVCPRCGQPHPRHSGSQSAPGWEGVWVGSEAESSDRCVACGHAFDDFHHATSTYSRGAWLAFARTDLDAVQGLCHIALSHPRVAARRVAVRALMQIVALEDLLERVNDPRRVACLGEVRTFRSAYAQIDLTVSWSPCAVVEAGDDSVPSNDLADHFRPPHTIWDLDRVVVPEDWGYDDLPYKAKVLLELAEGVEREHVAASRRGSPRTMHADPPRASCRWDTSPEAARQ